MDDLQNYMLVFHKSIICKKWLKVEFNLELTFQAVANIFRVELTVMSTLGKAGKLKSPRNVPFSRGCVQRFEEKQCERYVVVEPNDIYDFRIDMSIANEKDTLLLIESAQPSENEDSAEDLTLQKSNQTHKEGTLNCILENGTVKVVVIIIIAMIFIIFKLFTLAK